MTWDVKEKKEVLETIPFNVEELVFHYNSKDTHKYHRLISPNWVTIIPVTIDHKVIMIKQFRAGELSYVIEAPGGVIDDHEPPSQSAFRELEEETGYSAHEMKEIISINPNPAINNNRIFLFLALGCQPAKPRTHFPDPGEDISIEYIELDQIEDYVRQGKINNALSALGIMMSLKFMFEKAQE